MENLGIKISEYRKQLDLTQKDLGDKLNVSPQAVSKWENGQAEPDASTIKKLCEIFAISTDELLGNEPPVKEIAVTAAPVQTVVQPVVERVVERQVEQKIINGYCERCKKPVGPGEYVVEHHRGGSQNIYCNECKAELDALDRRYAYSSHKSATVKSIIWGGVAGVAVLILFLVSCIVEQSEELPLYAGIPISIYIGYAVFAFVTQMFWGNSVTDLFFLFLKSFRMPGVIFTLDLDGLIFLIVVKIGLSILSVILSVLLFLIGIIITPTYAALIFPVTLIRRLMENKSLKEAANKEG